MKELWRWWSLLVVVTTIRVSARIPNRNCRHGYCSFKCREIANEVLMLLWIVPLLPRGFWLSPSIPKTPRHPPAVDFSNTSVILTGGGYSAPSGMSQVGEAFTQVLLSVFLAPEPCRTVLNMPALNKVDLRARCFETCATADQGFLFAIRVWVFFKIVPVVSIATLVKPRLSWVQLETKINLLWPHAFLYNVTASDGMW